MQPVVWNEAVKLNGADRRWRMEAADKEQLSSSAGLPAYGEDRDARFLPPDGPDDAATFVVACRQLRFYQREATLRPV